MNVSANKEEPILNYGPISALIISVGTFFGSQILAVVAIGLIPAIILGWKTNQIIDWLESGVVLQSLTVFLSGLFTLFILGWFLKKYKNSFKQLGIIKPKITDILRASLGFLVYIAMYLALLAIIKTLIPSLNLDQKQDIGFDFNSAKNNVLLLIFSLVVVAPVVEEIVMRGFLFGGLRTKLDFKTSTIITSLLFALAHLPSGVDGLLWVGAIDTFTLSVVLCYLREKTGSLWPSIFLHALKNSLALLYLVKFT